MLMCVNIEEPKRYNQKWKRNLEKQKKAAAFL